MKITETLVTPEMATKWLEEGNVHNRSVRQSVVERYARDMANGDWMLTHEGIAFDNNGVLIDGQHRLWAVIESKTPTSFMVARGAETATQAVIDGSLPRTMVDTMKLAFGREVSANALSVAKALGTGKVKNTTMTRQEIARAYDDHREAIDFAMKVFTRKISGITTVPMYTVMARAFYSQDREKLTRFAEILTSGIVDPKDGGESSVLILRNWLLEKRPMRGTTAMAPSKAVYGKAERALEAFLQGEEVGILYAAKSELFPIPTELKAKTVKTGIGRHARTTRLKAARG